MAEPATGLFPQCGKYAGNARRISNIRTELVFRGPKQKAAENAYEISSLRAELVFRQIPGQLVQRRPQAQRFSRRILRDRALLNPVRGCILRVPLAPVCLCLLPAGCLALRFSAGALPLSDSRVRPKPLPANRARSLPGLWHGELPCSPRRGVTCRDSDQNRWVTSGKQRRVNSRARRSVPFSLMLFHCFLKFDAREQLQQLRENAAYSIQGGSLLFS
jgi:hypothetical protein